MELPIRSSQDAEHPPEGSPSSRCNKSLEWFLVRSVKGNKPKELALLSMYQIFQTCQNIISFNGDGNEPH